MCKIITASDLQSRSDHELSVLFRSVSQNLARSAPGSVERRNALASLENISRTMAARKTRHLKPPGF